MQQDCPTGILSHTGPPSLDRSHRLQRRQKLGEAFYYNFQSLLELLTECGWSATAASECLGCVPYPSEARKSSVLTAQARQIARAATATEENAIVSALVSTADSSRRHLDNRRVPIHVHLELRRSVDVDGIEVLLHTRRVRTRRGL